eukprot:jgi/Botrbrau1/6764/Bobra.0324s0044.1
MQTLGRSDPFGLGKQVRSEVWFDHGIHGGGDLKRALQEGDSYRWGKRGPQAAYEIASALAYLHSYSIHTLGCQIGQCVTEQGMGKQSCALWD